MYTIVFLTRRVDGMTREVFFEHYRTTHYELASRLPGLVSYQQSEIGHGEQAWTTPDPTPESFPGYDALSIYTFGSRKAALAAFASPEGLLVEQDTGKFMDWPSVLSIPTEAIGRFDADPA